MLLLWSEKKSFCSFCKLIYNMTMINQVEAEQQIACVNCVREDYLQELIKANGQLFECTFCSQRALAIPLNQLVDSIRHGLSHHYERLGEGIPEFDEPVIRKSAGNCFSAFQIVQAEAKVSEAISRSVLESLSLRDSDEYWDEWPSGDPVLFRRVDPDHLEWHRSWHSFEKSLKTQNRFFNCEVQEFLNKIFAGLVSHEISDDKDVTTIWGPGTNIQDLYRARVFQNDENLYAALKKPAKWLGPPLENARPGRMNAQGISVFYGSTGPDAAVSEVRPPVGSKVAVAKFVLQKNVRLLDLSLLASLNETGSIFDPGFTDRLKRSQYLKAFCLRITMPVMPESESTDYIITQAIADYLAEVHVGIDGIVYPSAQSGNNDITNVVLFHKSSRASGATDGEYQASIYMQGEDAVYPEYNLRQISPDPDGWGTVFESEHSRPQVLKLDESNIIVRHITGVKFDSVGARNFL